MKEEHTYFQNALSDFVFDVSSGGALRHLANLGYTVEEIYGRLDYPTTRERVGAAVWKHYLEQNIVRFELPKEDEEKRNYRIIKEQTDYGKVTFRRVEVAPTEVVKQEYVYLPIGKLRYQRPGEYESFLAKLQERDREYVTGLPWELRPTYVVKDERTARIAETLAPYLLEKQQ